MKIKKPTKKQVNNGLYAVAIVALVAIGVMGTLQYQKFISNVKAEGVAEFKLDKCDRYTSKEGKSWIECNE